MNNSVRENIYRALNDLHIIEFKEFKWRIEDVNYDGKPNIPRSRLQKADILEIVDLMIQNYGEDAAWKVCVHVLQKCNVKNVSRKLKETMQKVAGAVTHQVPDSPDYRSHVKEKFQIIKDPNSYLGEYEHLNERFSNPIILGYDRPENERECEIMASGKIHAEIMNRRACYSTSIEKLFDPDKHGRIPQVIVLKGPAGIGKTMIARKIMFDWASEELYQDMFNYVFYIHCREMNLHTDTEESSIAEIISKQWPCNHEVKDTIDAILRNPKKLLFIIDGFDELRFSFEQPKSCLCTDPWKKAKITVLLRSLFQKKVLTNSYLIITTRPTALEKLHKCVVHLHAFEILGFAIQERHKYFHNFFKKEEQAIQAIKFVEQNDILFTMCVIPLVCWIICTVIKQEMDRGKGLQQTPYTLTAVYMLYLSSLLKFHHKESDQDIKRNLKGLCSLAAEGIWKQEILFSEEELQKHSLVEEDSLPLFLNENIFKRDIERVHSFNFIHLSFQEFFAALFYILEEGEEQHFKNLNENLHMLLERSLSSRLDLTVTVQFLFGLLNEEKRINNLKKEFGWQISPAIKTFLFGWVKNIIKEWKEYSHRGKEIFSYLYEMQDNSFTKNALEFMTELSFDCNSGTELMVLTYCLQHCRSLEKLYIDGPSNPILRDEELFPSSHERNLVAGSMELLCKALTSLRNLKKLRFRRGFLKESCCKHIAEILQLNQRLRELYLCDGSINNVGMKLLCEGLKHPNCKLEKLRLYDESLTKSCGRCLAEVLRGNHHLRELSLSPYNIDEEGMELLCEGLKHRDCKLEKLWVRRGFLSETSCRHLAEVLRKKQELRELYLSDGGIDDEGIGLLCKGLKHPDCKLEKLWLSSVSLTDSCGQLLGEALKQNQSLTELDLSHSARSDKGFKFLCDGLKHPDCKLEKLRLFRGSFSKSQCRDFGDVFKKSQMLRELELSYCHMDEQEMELLCEGLKHPSCPLEKLCFSTEFKNNDFYRCIAEILRESQSLTVLELSPCDISGNDVQVLCEGLKHPDCKLGTFWLSCCTLTDSCCTYLADVLRKNQKLTELALSPTSRDDRAFELLCEGLKHPGCKLKKLRLSRGFLTEFSCRHLAEVLRENQGLKELDLFPSDTVSKAVEQLFEELKHPDRKLEKVWLNGECIDREQREETFIGIVPWILSSIVKIYRRLFS